MTTGVRVLTDTADVTDTARCAIAAMLDGGPAVAVLPQGPAPWRAAAERAVRPDRPTDAGLVVPTSGSTGDPVGVVLGAEAVRWSAEQTAARLERPAGWVLALPLTHVAGLMVLARAVVSRALVARARPDVRLADALHAAADRLTARGSPTTATSLVPTQVRRLLAEDPSALRRFDRVLVGGAALDASTRGQADDEGIRVVTSYGMTETCGGVVHDGLPLPGASVSLDAQGVVSVDGPMLATSYREPLRDEPLSRPFVTHDVGRWVAGRLTVTGRSDDVVLSGGVSVPLPAVDALLSGHPAVADAAAVGLPDDEWGTRIVALVVASGPLDPDDVRAYVARRAEAAYVPAEVVVVDALPRPSPGKLNRAALAARAQGG